MVNQPSGVSRNPAQEKRTERRVSGEAHVTIAFLSTSDTWQPSVQVGHSIDVSLRGTKVFVSELSNEIYHRLLKDFRRVLVTFRESDATESIELIGQIIWIDYHKDDATEHSGPCYLGVYFDNLKPEVALRYQKLVEGLKK